MKVVQCYELFGGIALKNHTFSFSFSFREMFNVVFIVKILKYFLLLIAGHI